MGKKREGNEARSKKEKTEGVEEIGWGKIEVTTCNETNHHVGVTIVGGEH